MRTRRGLRLWHRWFGILAGLWLGLLALSGSAIAFYDEIDAALNPDLRRVEAKAGPRAPLDLANANAERALPGFSLDNVILAQRPDASHWLLGRRDSGGEMMGVQVFADPYSGRILGWRDSEALALDRRHIPDLLYGLHTELLAGEIGAWIAGLVALAWLIDHALALPLAFPRARHWRSAFTLAGPRGSLRRLFDWHRAKGVWLWAGTFVLAVTSVTLIFPVASRHLVGEVSTISCRLHETMPEVEPPASPIGLDRAVAIVERQEKRIYGLRVFPWAGVYAVRSYHPRDPDDQGRMWTYVSMADGSIAGERHDMGSSAGDAFFGWQYPLHSGRFGGLPGRILAALLGLMTAWLCYSGLKLFIVRSRTPGRAAPHAP
jgi:uncharacterized iron-regulated membrane protein